MRNDSGWQPVVPSHYLRTADNIVAGFLDGGELALWRAADGAAQAWENRCPHRGTRLTLGRIIDGRVSCAYHGWEFSVDGRCSAIPAHPSMPVPKNVSVATYAVREAAGMVWVCKGAADAGEEAMPAVGEGAHFCRSQGIEAAAERVTEELRKLHFEQVAANTWSGMLASQRCTVFLNAGGPALTFAHVWFAEKPQATQIRPVMASLARLRDRAELQQSVESAA
ncbi:MAG TPA: Rieske (2Fe-2S) protein [Ramlibacter sp.]|nr:Rieske (2Fe-2S) protein [Ramlibacter sp.]